MHLCKNVRGSIFHNGHTLERARTPLSPLPGTGSTRGGAAAHWNTTGPHKGKAAGTHKRRANAEPGASCEQRTHCVTHAKFQNQQLPLRLSKRGAGYPGRGRW